MFDRRTWLQTVAGFSAIATTANKLFAIRKNSDYNEKTVEWQNVNIKDVLIKNQQIFNEYQSEKYNDHKDFTLKVIDKLCDNLISPDIFSMQPFTKNEGLAFYLSTTIDLLAINSMDLKCQNFNTNITGKYFKDFQDEILEAVATELSIVIDRNNINNCMKNSGTIAAWDFRNALGDTIKEKYESLYVKIFEISNVIHNKTRRGGANWIVTSPEISSIFETASSGFEPSPIEEFYKLGIMCVGTVNNRFKLYKDPLFPKNKMLLGYKGTKIDSGYVYCPHLIFSDYSQNCVVNSSASGFIPNGENYYSVINVLNFL